MSKFNRTRMYEIQNNLLPIYIASQGFSRSTPERFGGLSALDLNLHYTCQKTKLLLYHLRKQYTTGKLAAITMKNHQLELGTSTPIFESDWNTASALVAKIFFFKFMKISIKF